MTDENIIEKPIVEKPIVEKPADKYSEESREMLDFIHKYYATKVREPKSPSDSELSFWRLAGLETLSFTIPAMAMALFSAVRTGQFFFILEKLMLSSFNLFRNIGIGLLAFLVAFLALFGFEGYILARGFAKGREKVANSPDGIVVKANGLATFIAFLVIFSIGIFSSLELISNLSETFLRNINIYMIVLTGGGATVLVFYGGEDIGVSYENYTLKRKALLKAHEKEYNEWWQSGVRSFNSVKGKKVVPAVVNQPQVKNVPQSTEQPKSWRTLRKELSIEDVVALSKITNESDVQKMATEFGVDAKTIRNRIGYAVKEMAQPVSVQLDNFLNMYGAFPTDEQMRIMELEQRDVAVYVVDNKEVLVYNKHLSEDFISQAENLLYKES